jgi:hypothetical protein
MKNKYLEFIFDIYHKTPSVVRRDNVFHVRLTSKVVVLEIRNVCKFGLKNWTIPDWLVSEDEKVAWLKAFFSAEAYVGKNHIKLQTVNKEGMSGVLKLLKEVGIDVKCYEYLPKNERNSKVYMLIISKKKEINIFYEKIGFWHERKQSALKKHYVYK